MTVEAEQLLTGVDILQTLRVDHQAHLLTKGAYPEFVRGDERSLLWFAVKAKCNVETVSLLVLLETQD